MNFSDNITALKGIGEKTSTLFNRVGVFSLWDLLMYIPRDFVEYPAVKTVREIRPGETAALFLTVKTEPNVIRARRLTILSVMASDSEGNMIKLKWFNSPYLKNLLRPGMSRVFYGRAGASDASVELTHPKFFEKTEYDRLIGIMQPVYPLTKGLTSKTIGQAVEKVLVCTVF